MNEIAKRKMRIRQQIRDLKRELANIDKGVIEYGVLTYEKETLSDGTAHRKIKIDPLHHTNRFTMATSNNNIHELIVYITQLQNNLSSLKTQLNEELEGKEKDI